MTARSTTLDRIELFVLIAGLCVMAAALRFEISGDGTVRYGMLQQMVEDHRISADGHSMVHVFAAAPLYLAGKIAGHPDRAVQRFNLVIFAGLLVVLYRRLSASTETKLLRAWFLVMLSCSMFLHHLRMFYTEVFSTAATMTGLAAAVTGAPIVGAFAMSVGAINSPTLLVPLGLVAVKLAWDDNRLWPLSMPIVSAFGVLLENWSRRGHLFVTGYEGNVGFATLLPYSGRPEFSYPFVLGVFSILFSFGKGLLFFAPGLLLSRSAIDGLPVGSPLRRLQELSLLFLAGMVIVYAKWWAWYGGWFWGPRFFLLASVPASFALAFHLRNPGSSRPRNAAVLLILLFSAWIGIDGAIFGQAGLEAIGMANNYALESFVWYVPEFSPLWYPLIKHPALVTADLVVVVYCVAVTGCLAVPLVRSTTKRSDSAAALSTRLVTAAGTNARE